jgi:hypothetical protein
MNRSLSPPHSAESGVALHSFGVIVACEVAAMVAHNQTVEMQLGNIAPVLVHYTADVLFRDL